MDTGRVLILQWVPDLQLNSRADYLKPRSVHKVKGELVRLVMSNWCIANRKPRRSRSVHVGVSIKLVPFGAGAGWMHFADGRCRPMVLMSMRSKIFPRVVVEVTVGVVMHLAPDV